jgi:hypothetical protein
MVKLALAAVSLVTVLGTAQVYAQSTQPSQCMAQIEKTESLLATISDTPEKAGVVKEVTTARDMAAKKDETGCMAQMSAVQDRLLDLQKRGQSSD